MFVFPVGGFVANTPKQDLLELSLNEILCFDSPALIFLRFYAVSVDLEIVSDVIRSLLMTSQEETAS